MSLLSMGSNEANLRAAEENWLDPDYEPNIHSMGGVWDDDNVLTTCEFCNEYKYEHEIFNVGGFKICEDCAEEIVDVWNRRFGKR